MRTTRSVLAIVAAIAIPVPLTVLGQGSQTGKVEKIMTRAHDGLIAIHVAGAWVNRPPCATHPYWLIKDENSATGKRQLALLMLAYASGKTVWISGAGACTRWVDGEDINVVELHP